MSTPNRPVRQSKGATIDGKPAGGQFAEKGVPKLPDDTTALSFNDAADATLRSLEALGESMERSDEREEHLLRRLDESLARMQTKVGIFPAVIDERLQNLPQQTRLAADSILLAAIDGRCDCDTTPEACGVHETDGDNIFSRSYMAYKAALTAETGETFDSLSNVEAGRWHEQAETYAVAYMETGAVFPKPVPEPN